MNVSSWTTSNNLCLKKNLNSKSNAKEACKTSVICLVRKKGKSSKKTWLGKMPKSESWCKKWATKVKNKNNSKINPIFCLPKPKNCKKSKNNLLHISNSNQQLPLLLHRFNFLNLLFLWNLLKLDLMPFASLRTLHPSLLMWFS